MSKIIQYINVNDPRFTWGQKADGTWYCKEFKTDSIEQANTEINLINGVLNEYNKKDEKKEKKE